MRAGKVCITVVIAPVALIACTGNDAVPSAVGKALPSKIIVLLALNGPPPTDTCVLALPATIVVGVTAWMTGTRSVPAKSLFRLV